MAYKGYEKMVKAGIKNVCIHKGLFAPGVEKAFPNLRGFADVADVGQATTRYGYVVPNKPMDHSVFA